MHLQQTTLIRAEHIEPDRDIMLRDRRRECLMIVTLS